MLESVQLALSETNRGLLLARDEIVGLFEFGRYGHGNRGAAERAWLLQTYEGGNYKVTRLTRPSLLIAVNALTIYGNVQPSRLAEFEGLERDGLIQRFTLYAREPSPPHATISSCADPPTELMPSYARWRGWMPRPLSSTIPPLTAKS